MRIFDRIASGMTVFDVDWQPMPAEQASTLRKVVHEFPRLVVDEASEYLAMHSNDSWEPNTDFGIMRPPFETIWVEWQTPDKKRHQGQVIDWDKNQYACAVLPSAKPNFRFGGMAFMSNENSDVVIQVPVSPAIAADWSVHFGVVKASLDNWIKLNGQGLSEDQMWSSFGYDLLPLWLGMAWSNCLTFELIDDGPSEQLRKKRHRKGHFPGLEYKRIVIGKKQRKRWESQTGESSKRFHLVRGHFADYRERGLFGKADMKGVFWIPGHARGDKSLGTINKEYHVTAEAAT